MHKYGDLKGQRFGRLIAQEFTGVDKGRNAIWLCQCDCGSSKKATAICLKRGDTRSCGCLAKECKREGRKRIDIASKRFGKLIALIPSSGYKWLCQCDCGKQKEVYIGSLLSGDTRSCGCLPRKPRKFSNLDEQSILDAYNSGVLVSDLAQQYGCSKTTVYKIIRQQKEVKTDDK